jgi:hypothetical protein
MNIIKNQILILCIFIICIGLITYFYIKNKNYENFDNSNLTEFDDVQIPNLKVKTAINSQLIDFNTIINKYSQINPFITATSDGKLCDSSSTLTPNFCEINSSSGSNNPTCLLNGLSASCSKLFSDGYLNNISNIDLNSLTSSTQSNIISASTLLIEDINDKNATINDILDKILAKLELQSQQKFIKNNTADTINNKKIILKNTTNEFEKLENDVFINQYNFQNYLTQNNNNNKKIALYRNILYGLVIAIIVVGIFLYFVS